MQVQVDTTEEPVAEVTAEAGLAAIMQVARLVQPTLVAVVAVDLVQNPIIAPLELQVVVVWYTLLALSKLQELQVLQLQVPLEVIITISLLVAEPLPFRKKLWHILQSLELIM
jgi:hypothetical protein